MKVYFSHGRESGPWGSKIKRLAAIAEEHECEVNCIDYTDLPDPDLRVDRLVNILKNEEDNFLLVGSSMGGYVSLVAAEQVKAKAIFLLAPALYMQDYQWQEYRAHSSRIEIVHGWSDDVIPPEHSIRFAKEANCSLHLISGDHRLNSSLNIVENIFKQFLCTVLGVNPGKPPNVTKMAVAHSWRGLQSW